MVLTTGDHLQSFEWISLPSLCNEESTLIPLPIWGRFWRPDKGHSFGVEIQTQSQTQKATCSMSLCNGRNCFRQANKPRATENRLVFAYGLGGARGRDYGDVRFLWEARNVLKWDSSVTHAHQCYEHIP